MKAVIWVGAVVLAVSLVVAGVLIVLDGDSGRDSPQIKGPAESTLPRRQAPAEVVPLFSAGFIDDSGYELALNYTPPIADRASIAEVAGAYRQRAERCRADIRERLNALERTSPRPEDYDRRRAMLQVFGGLAEMYEGKFEEAMPWFERAIHENASIAPDLRTNIGVLRGIASLRRGEIENCVACLGPSSCIFPIAPDARHLQPYGSREASRYFLEYLHQRPDDLGVRWLLNLAAMTIGEYPDGVPEAYRLPPESPSASLKVGRFLNVASEAGLNTRGPNMLGGSVADDFTGDGLPDILVTSGDWDRDAALFVNQGNGRFIDLGASAGLGGQVLAVNASQADYDNDGKLDVLAIRGGWEMPCRLSLLRNKGGSFEDVTIAAGLGEPIASQSAAWGDFDGDGHLDLFVAGEYRERPVDPRNRCRLYRNRGDGTFEDVAAKAGVENERWAKGASWGDYNDDGAPDLYVSNMNGANRLYRNNRDGTFTDVAPVIGLIWPLRSFSCWFWDFDDDGKLDLFVTGFGATLHQVIADRLGRPSDGERPRLYRNLGEGRFQDVAIEAGLDHVYLPMGSNFADVDNDGRLDLYLATGRPSYSVLTPNVMFRNVDGLRFEDVTTASGTGHLQKGHGVSFADFDDDGDVDLFVQVGGQTPGDRAHNVLFRNPGHGHHRIRLRLVGTKSNRSAIGAKIRVDLVMPGGGRRSIYRVIGGGSSFGGNTLSPTIGLADATAIESISVTWPGSGTIQTFRSIAMDGAIEITEGNSSPTPIPPRLAK